MKVGGDNNHNIQHIRKAKLQQKGRQTNAIKYSYEVLNISIVHVNGDNVGMVGYVPDGL